MDLVGKHYAFPTEMVDTLAQLGSVQATPSPAFYTAVNVSIVWVAAPLAALLSRKRPLLGFGMIGLLVINSFLHIMPLFIKGYNAGLLTALVIFIPASFWIIKQNFGKNGAFPKAAMWAIIGVNAILHIILVGSIQLFVKGVIGSELLVIIQLLNAAIWFIGILAVDKKWVKTIA
ncbi:HXXEE domain-containing protein [Lonepinella sp. BR2882]|uniref:HXXEE domain-containing protein n=1 Tax=Lonepinella sp. BR2882 TaxID=3095283 RepID=UPI003F6DFE0D